VREVLTVSRIQAEGLPTVQGNQQGGADQQEPLIRAVMPELDSIRGLAILLVLFYHGFFWSYRLAGLSGISKVMMLITQPGWLGVNLFFVLSGFLITGILLNSKSRIDYYSRFYTRRALRILPLYFAILPVVALFHLASWPFLALSFFYLSNVAPLFGVAAGYGVLWSLAVEEQFYLVWPAVVRRVSDRALLISAAAVTLVIPVLRGISFHFGFVEGLVHYTWFVADGLAMGALLAVLLCKFPPNRACLGTSAGIAIVLSIIASVAAVPFGILTHTRLIGAAFQASAANLFFAGGLVLCLLTGTSRWKSIVRIKLLRFFGEISYGLYLIHVLLFDGYDALARSYWPGVVAHGGLAAMWLRFVCVGGTAVCLACLSRRYFEERFLRLKDKLLFSTPDRARVAVPMV
jgi:peptidoglycan/LPS O-acetylase OafA/YrhL